MDAAATLARPLDARSLAPVMAPERLPILEVLRGLALLGVVVANVWL